MDTIGITKSTNKRIWIVWLALWSAAFSKALVMEGIAIGDVLFGCVAVVCLLSFFQMRQQYVPRWSVYVILLIIWAVVGGLIASGFSPFPFSEIEFLKSFTKLSFYGIGAILFASYIRKMEREALCKVVFSVLVINAFIAFYIYVAELIDQKWGIHLPYEFFWFGQGGPLSFGKSLSPWEIGDVTLNLARGIFSEPSTFGIFQILGLAFLYFKTPEITRRYSWKFILIFASLLLTFSVSTYILLSVLLVILILKNRKPKRLFSLLLKIMLGTVIVIILLYTLTPLRISEVFYNRIIQRSVAFVQGEDRSGMVRVLGSLETAKEIITKSPFVGSGLGNLDIAFYSTGRILHYSTLVFTHAAMFNILFYVLGAMGILGFVIFILLVGHLVIRFPAAGVVFLVSLFASGNLLETTFWVYYVLLNVIAYHPFWGSQNEKT